MYPVVWGKGKKLTGLVNEHMAVGMMMETGCRRLEVFFEENNMEHVFVPMTSASTLLPDSQVCISQGAFLSLACT